MARGHHPGLLSFLALLIIFCFSSEALAAGVVNTTNQSSLVAAMAGGGTVTFAVDGTIYLSSTIVVSNNTVIDGTGHTIAVSGSNAVQIFIVNTNTKLALTNLTLRDGYVQGEFRSEPYAFLNGNGGAISNAGTLQMTSCSFVNNGAFAGESDNGSGGAIYNIGTMQAASCSFSNNTASGGTNGMPYYGGGGTGGAVVNTGVVALAGCAFVGNSAIGAFGLSDGPSMLSDGGAAQGGAVFNGNQATVSNCIFFNNSASGGQGGTDGNIENSPGLSGGTANGGAFCNSGNLVASNNTFAQNVATGGQGGLGGSEYIYSYAFNGAGGGAGGASSGGAVCCLGGSSILVNDTFWSNSAVGGAGGTGGAGSPATEGSYGQDGSGGNGGQGGNGIGGALYASGGSLLAWNVTVASNAATGGAGGAGGAGGSAIETISGSAGSPGAAGPGQGDSVGNGGSAITLKNSILCANASSDTNISGTIVDAGNNIDSIAENALTNSTSLNGVDPGLAALGDNGGPTPTMALLPGSPAIDAADPTDFPATDQRGVPRPFGPAPDIGAFESTLSVIISGQITGLVPGDEVTVNCGHELTATTNGGTFSFAVDEDSFVVSPSSLNYVFSPRSQTVSLSSNQSGVNFQAYRMNTITLDNALADSLNLIFAGSTGQSFRIEASTNFTSWSPITTNIIREAGYVSDSIPLLNEGSRFFRVVSP